MKYVLIIILFVNFKNNIIAQNSVIDSFYTTLKKTKIADSLIVKKTCEFLFHYSKQNFDTSLKELQKLQNKPLVRRAKYYTTTVKYYLGNIFFLKSKYVDALKYYNEAIFLAESIEHPHHKKILLQNLYSNAGLAYVAINDYENGFNYTVKALPFAIKGSQETATYSYLFVGYIAKSMKNNERAIYYLEEGLKYRSKNLKNPEYTLQLLQSIIELEFEQKQDKLSKKAEIIADSLMLVGNFNVEAKLTYHTIKGLMLKKNKQFEQALKLFQKSYYFAKEYGYPPAIALSNYYLADIQHLLKQDSKAEINYQTALKAAKNNDNNLHIEILEKVAKFYSEIMDYKKSSENYQMAYTLKDSLTQVQNHDKLLINDAKYQLTEKNKILDSFEKVQKANEEKLKKQKYWIFGLVSGILLIGIFCFSIYKNLKYRNKIAEQENIQLKQEKQLTAVSSIMQGQEEERSRMAKDLHDGLGGMLSGIKLNLSAMKGNQILQERDANIFSRSIEQLDGAIKEMRRVAHNMMPEALLKFGLNEAVQDFCDGINQAGSVKMTFNHFGAAIPADQSLQVILYRIIQELSNNAIKYANAATIFIQLTRHETGISLTVEDDGQGFDVASLEKNKGTGLNNVISRVNYLKGKFTIDSEIGKGTSCFVEIPI